MTEATFDRLYQIFARIWAGFALLLIASTWKLWTPQTVFPQIPFLEFFVEVPGWVDWIALAIVSLSLTACLIVNSRSLVPTLLWLFAISASVLILLNQHRLQPWAYQFVVFAIIMATARPRTAFSWMRWIVISIYIYSAISKFDYQFVHSVGDRMLWSLGEKFALDTHSWSEPLRNWIVFTFPLSELLIGVGLMIPRVRRFAMFGAVMMHLTLLAALQGNVEAPGVLIWNVFFIVQAVVLFGLSLDPETTSNGKQNPIDHPESGELTTTRRTSFLSGFVATAVSLFVLLFPLTQPIGICDHWPAWQVFAPRTSRAKIPSYSSEIDELWPSFHSWSEFTLQVPVYPQARFQLAVAVAAQQKFPNAKGLPIEVSGESNRWTGVRESETLTGDQVRMKVERYWLNTKARSFWISKE